MKGCSVPTNARRGVKLWIIGLEFILGLLFGP